MTEGPFAETAAFFDRLVERHGDDARSSDWGSDRSQRLRFEVLARGCPLGDARVLDVGCGIARFADFLAARADDVDYVGVDLSPRAIAAARAAHPALDLRVANVLDLDPASERFDVVVANGVFYRLGPGGAALVRPLVERMWELARRTVAFTSLSAWAGEPAADELHLDPVEALALARSLTPFVTLRHDYLRHDFALFLHREQQPR